VRINTHANNKNKGADYKLGVFGIIGWQDLLIVILINIAVLCTLNTYP
jgi:hypothetical protein